MSRVVLILDGNSEHVAHAKEKKFYLLSILSNAVFRSKLMISPNTCVPTSELPPYTDTMMSRVQGEQ